MRISSNKLFLLFLSLCLVAVSLGAQSGTAKQLTGSGATFPEPLYRKMFDEYNKKTSVKVNYQGIGSGGGIKQLSEKVTDFGGTDAFMTDAEIKAAGAEIVHIPTCIGAVVVVYNLPGIKSGLKLTPETISGIFLGKITKWNDPQIASLNTGYTLPALGISIVHRSDGSGTSFVFTDYLSKASREWKEKVGANKSPSWPAGIGGKGNPGVADLVGKIPGAIGYVEIAYAVLNGITFADVKNKSGNFITPSLESASIAADIKLPNDTRVSITDTDAENGYPIASFTWLIVYKEQSYNNRDRKTAASLTDMLWWMVHEGQAFAKPLSYSPIAQSVVAKAETLIKSMTYDGQPIRK